MCKSKFEFDFDFDLGVVDLAPKRFPDEIESELDAGHIFIKASTRICSNQSEIMPPQPSISARNSCRLKPLTY
jgi:hypothetical protein